jgi:hypothetical protein
MLAFAIRQYGIEPNITERHRSTLHQCKVHTPIEGKVYRVIFWSNGIYRFIFGVSALSRSRLRRMGSIITVIENTELLSALPVCQVARANHLEALDLLAILGDEIQSLTEQLA